MMQPGFAALLRPDGELVELLVDHLGLPAGRHLCDWIIEASADKARKFLARVGDSGGAFGWELTVRTEDADHALSFSGGKTRAGQFMVVAASSEGALEAMYGDLLRINNEQANMLRDLARRNAKSEPPEALMDAMMQLNNELTGLQRELAKKSRELERLNERKNEVLGMVAHDLRNPLGVISGYAKLMTSGITGELNERQSDMMGRIGLTSSHMLGMVDDLLDISAIESGRVELETEAIDPGALLSEAVSLSQSMAASKNIELVLEAGPLPGIRADNGKLRQVIDNLLSNAIKYSHPESRVRVMAVEEEGMLRVDVIDQGQGIPEEELGSLFRVFGKTSVKSTAGEKSTGLGLAIVKKIVDTHGGRIWAESEVGKGSTFSFTVPLDACQSS